MSTFKRRLKKAEERMQMSRVHGLKNSAHNRAIVNSVGRAIEAGLRALSS
jgi:hypothetical protein